MTVPLLGQQPEAYRPRIGDYVHLCDGTNCIPFLVNLAKDEPSGLLIGGWGFPTGQPIVLPAQVPQNPRPQTPLVILPDGMAQPPTWHTRAQCPWSR